jgi:hypothetical protein
MTFVVGRAQDGSVAEIITFFLYVDCFQFFVESFSDKKESELEFRDVQQEIQRRLFILFLRVVAV